MIKRYLTENEWHRLLQSYDPVVVENYRDEKGRIRTWRSLFFVVTENMPFDGLG